MDMCNRYLIKIIYLIKLINEGPNSKKLEI